MRRRRIIAMFTLLVLAAVACTSTKTKDSSLGVRVLEAVVVEREFEAPGTGGTSDRSSGSWYLVFEAREGEATAHYRYQVTRQQYFRFPEGTRVQLVLADNLLREIRPLPGS